jgi:hypothetical protein
VSIVLRGTRAQNLSGLTTASNVSLPVSTNAGDTIIVVVAAAGTNSYAGSGAGATWVNPVNKAGAAPTLTVMIGYNTTAGQSTFKFATLGGTSGSAFIAVYSGLRATSSPVLQASSGQNSTIFLSSFTVGNLILFADGGYTMPGNLGSLALNPGGAIPVTYLGISNYNSRSVDLSALIVSGTYVNMLPNWSNYYASGVGMIELAALNAPTYTKNSATTTIVSRISLNGTSSQASYSRVITAKTKTFIVTAFGNGQWTPPVGVTSATVELWGAGGGGGGGDQNGYGEGWGGGGGGYSIKTISIKSSSTYTYTVGAGGIGNTNGSDGTNGGTTSFSQDGVIIFDATGGGGGGGGDQTGGLSGAAGGTNYAASVSASYVGGLGSYIAGGAGATSLSNGMSGVSGGQNLNGLGTGGTSNNIGQFGSNGGSPGGGGGGSYDYGNQSGNGADGMMIITYVVNNNYSGGFSMLGIG